MGAGEEGGWSVCSRRRLRREGVRRGWGRCVVPPPLLLVWCSRRSTLLSELRRPSFLFQLRLCCSFPHHVSCLGACRTESERWGALCWFRFAVCPWSFPPSAVYSPTFIAPLSSPALYLQHMEPPGQWSGREGGLASACDTLPRVRRTRWTGGRVGRRAH